MSWWTFSWWRGLPPLKEEVRTHDHEIMALDRLIGEASVEVALSRQRLEQAIKKKSEEITSVAKTDIGTGR